MITNLPLPNHILYVCYISVIAMTVSDFSTLAQQKKRPRYGQSRRFGKAVRGPWIWKDIGRSVPETRAAGAASIGLWFINVRKPYVNGLVAWCAVRDKLQPPYFMGKSKEIWKIL
jgi:hypothetical protein